MCIIKVLTIAYRILQAVILQHLSNIYCIVVTGNKIKDSISYLLELSALVSVLYSWGGPVDTQGAQ